MQALNAFGLAACSLRLPLAISCEGRGPVGCEGRVRVGWRRGEADSGGFE